MQSPENAGKCVTWGIVIAVLSIISMVIGLMEPTMGKKVDQRHLENAACAQIGEKVFMVKGYECDFESDEVQSILGSLRWN